MPTDCCPDRAECIERRAAIKSDASQSESDGSEFGGSDVDFDSEDALTALSSDGESAFTGESPTPRAPAKGKGKGKALSKAKAPSKAKTNAKSASKGKKTPTKAFAGKGRRTLVGKDQARLEIMHTSSIRVSVDILQF